MTEMLGAVRDGSLRRQLAALAAAVMLVSLGIGFSASQAEAAEEKVIVTFTFDDARVSQYRCSRLRRPRREGNLLRQHRADGHERCHDVSPAAGHLWCRTRDRGPHRPPHALTDVDEATARAEIEADVTTLQAQGFPRPCRSRTPSATTGRRRSHGRAGGLRLRPPSTPTGARRRPADDTLRIVRDSLDGSEACRRSRTTCWRLRPPPGKTWIVYLMHEFYSPIDEEIDEFLTWLGPRAASGTVVKTVRDVMLPAGNQPPWRRPVPSRRWPWLERDPGRFGQP